jgi:uncharacterized protein YecE (DUF72 family)
MTAAEPLAVGGGVVRYGSCSWADRSLVREGAFYPKLTMKAAERLAFYASRLPLVEVTSTYYFPPTPDLARQWVARTPPGFTMDIRGWSLLSGNPTFPNSLWEDLQDAVRPESRDRRRLYPQHLPDDAVDECWARFRHALLPLHDAGRLGAVILQYPSWFTPKEETRTELAAIAARLEPFRVAVDLRSPKWLAEGVCDETLGDLERAGLAFVCSDVPAAWERPAVVAATTDLAIVRFHGRGHRHLAGGEHGGEDAGEGQPTGDGMDLEDGSPGELWPWPYRYSTGELAGWVPAVRELAASAGDVHLLWANCWRDDAVANALELAALLRDGPVASG